MNTEHSAKTKTLIATYHELTRRQRALPPSEQWTLGGEVRSAKAEALVSIEYDKLHFDRSLPD